MLETEVLETEGLEQCLAYLVLMKYTIRSVPKKAKHVHPGHLFLLIWVLESVESEP